MTQTYSDFQPTGMDPRGLGCDDQQDWFVAPVSINRDTERGLATANWQAAQDDLDREKIKYEIHRFGHWANGWFEIILVEPTEAGQKWIDDTEEALDDYLVLDENLMSLHETEAEDSAWEYFYRDAFERSIDPDGEVDLTPDQLDDLWAWGATQHGRYFGGGSMYGEWEHTSEGACLRNLEEVAQLVTEAIDQAYAEDQINGLGK